MGHKEAMKICEKRTDPGLKSGIGNESPEKLPSPDKQIGNARIHTTCRHSLTQERTIVSPSSWQKTTTAESSAPRWRIYRRICSRRDHSRRCAGKYKKLRPSAAPADPA